MPSLRSNVRRTSTPNSTNASFNSTPTTSPRRAPQCSKCGRPRAGHPRQGCPFADSPLNRQATELNIVDDPEQITNDFDSMHIRPPELDEEEKRNRRRSSLNKQPRVPDASLASLSTNSSEIISKLLTPGIMDNPSNDETDRRRKNVSQRQAGLVARTKVKSEKNGTVNVARTIMPGTLRTPSPSFYQLESTQNSCKTECQDDEATQTQIQTFFAASDHCHPLVRSSSVEEREAFLAELSSSTSAPPATVYALPMSDIPAIKKSAEKIGFHSRVVESRTNNQDGWLILGHDLSAVTTLQKELEANRDAGGQPNAGNKNQESKLKVAAGGVVVGAVATWTGLAFS
jgi:hypothetical protein